MTADHALEITGGTTTESWICSHAENLKGCHQPAVYIIQMGQLRVGSCFLHRQAIEESLRPTIYVWNLNGTRVVS